MEKLWCVSTGTFVVQLIIGAGVYAGSHNVAFASAIAALASFVVPVFLISGLLSVNEMSSVMLTMLNATVAALGVSGALAGWWSLAWMMLVTLIAIGVDGPAAVIMKDEGVQDKKLLLTLTALPLGIGTVLGGAIILYRTFHKSNKAA